MVRNKEEERRLPVPATRREWVWDPMTPSVEGPTALTTGETNGQHGYCRPSPVLTPQQVFSFVCRHQPSELLPVPSPSQAPGATPGSAPADSSAYYGSMSARHQPRPRGWSPLLCLHSGLDLPAVHRHTIGQTPITGSTATCMLVVRS